MYKYQRHLCNHHTTPDESRLLNDVGLRLQPDKRPNRPEGSEFGRQRDREPLRDRERQREREREERELVNGIIKGGVDAVDP